ncbi:MAG TPA: YncE family protein [Blastocatellia bacterium]|nr:YncE family protein [Blastocatellia bacterium]
MRRRLRKAPTAHPRAFLLALLALAALLLSLPQELPPAVGAQGMNPARGIAPSGDLTELSIDDGQAEFTLGHAADISAPQSGIPGFGWVNQLTPPQYPATLRSITVGFNRDNQPGNEVLPDALYRVVVYKDPEMDGPADGQQPDAAFTGRVRGLREAFMTFNMISPITITEGSFVVGVIDEIGQAGFPALADAPGTSDPPGTEAFATFNGGITWVTLADLNLPDPPPVRPGSWMIRATVETDPADVLAVTATVKDPLAVEPWSAAVDGMGFEVFVTNYVSDNMTIIRAGDNSFRNLPLGDGPGETPDGPFGVVVGPDGNRVYVTLFGSNTIPSKEFPIDFSAVGDGRVAVLAKQADGSFTPSTEINVGKGPMFPALSLDGAKLYVPCAGADRVDVINTSTNQKVKEIAVGAQPSSCALSLDGTKLYVTNFGDGTVSVINTATDQKIKDISFPSAAPAPLNLWKGAVSPFNGHLYVTSWTPGGLLVIDTCGDELLRLLPDASTQGTPAGSAGASGIPAPTAPLARDAASGLTPEAGGGGGGPFGIASCRSGPAVVYTNDALGLTSVLDSRIDQVVSAPGLAVASCPKPRDLACAPIPQATPPGTPAQFKTFAYVACGQPDNSVRVVNIPPLPDNLQLVPGSFVAFFDENRLTINGSNFTEGIRVELAGVNTADGSGCAAFVKEPKIKKSGTQLRQKGKLEDGRSIREALSDAPRPYIRLVAPDGTVRVNRCCGIIN